MESQVSKGFQTNSPCWGNPQPVASIGSYQAGISASYTNILGIGDRLSAQYGIIEGLDPYDVGYSIPVNPREGTLTLRYGNNNSNIVTEDFADLGIRSKAETFSVGFRQPIERTPTTEFALGLGVDIRRSQTFILDDRPFSFSEGAEEGQSRVTAIRFSQDWVNRGRRQCWQRDRSLAWGLMPLMSQLMTLEQMDNSWRG